MTFLAHLRANNPPFPIKRLMNPLQEVWQLIGSRKANREPPPKYIWQKPEKAHPRRTGSLEKFKKNLQPLISLALPWNSQSKATNHLPLPKNIGTRPVPGERLPIGSGTGNSRLLQKYIWPAPAKTRPKPGKPS